MVVLTESSPQLDHFRTCSYGVAFDNTLPAEKLLIKFGVMVQKRCIISSIVVSSKIRRNVDNKI